ncbi:RPII140-upstream gene protein [Diachasma alloeum]|uniref:RPII140-upstream gene protein n=1 Tax=Diachasma alloeum TaxID=454923 RepID=UPI0007385086|nr:RPII140-upstream gene protein [Diachasma alloeum]
MFAVLRRIPKSRLALFGFFPQSADEVKTPGYEELNPQYRGIEAVRRLFRPDEYGELSQEMAAAVHMSGASVLLGAVYGAILHGREAWFAFMENNQATQFHHHMEAKKMLQDRVTMAICKGGFKWGFRIGGFTTVFIFLNTFIRVFRGEPGVIEYVGAGAITGGLFKLNLGPKGMFAGSLAGGFLGLLGGSVSMILLYLTGYTIDDIEKTQYEMHANRNEAVRTAMKLQMLDEHEKIQVLAAKVEEKLNRRPPLDGVPEIATEPLEGEQK